MKYTDCNLCGGRNLIFVLKGRDRRVRVDDKREFKLYKCRDCGLIFQNPRLEWEELKYFYCSDDGRQTYYDESNNPILRFFDNFKKKFKKPALWDCGKSGGKFLDIGCDKGLCEKTMIPLYPSWKFYGIEPNENSFMEASRVSGFRVRKGFLEEANFPDDFFNVILINHVLEHVLNPAGTLKECYRILKPGGAFNSRRAEF